MGWFKKEPDIWDEDQNKRLDALSNNQAVLVKNNGYFIADNKKLWEWVNHLRAKVAALEKKDREHKATDWKMKAVVDGLASVTQTTEAGEGGS